MSERYCKTCRHETDEPYSTERGFTNRMMCGAKPTIITAGALGTGHASAPRGCPGREPALVAAYVAERGGR